MNLKFAIVASNAQVSALLCQNFEENFGAEVDMFNSSKKLIDEINTGTVYSGVVAQSVNDEDQIAHNLLNFFYDHSQKTPLIIIGEFEHAFKNYALVSSKFRVEEINRLILKGLNLKKEDFKYLKLPDYIAYPIHYFYLMKEAPCDIYIKLNKKDGEEFVKRLNVLEAFSKDDLQKYEDHGLLEFYVLKEDSEKFLNFMLANSVNELKSASSDDKLNIIQDAFVISSDLLNKSGITTQAKVLADATISQIVAQVSRTDKLGELLRKILSDPHSFSFKRSYLISLLASAILPKLDWVNGEQQQIILTKISMVSFYHDIYLDDEIFLRIMTNAEYKKVEKNLVGREKELILNHANKAALLLQSYPKLPVGVDLIVKQHHGVTNGVGFTEAYSSSLAPLSILFIVLEEYAHQILICEDKLNLAVINEHMLKKFTQPSYKKIVNELIDLNKKPKK
jgi:hypothetical protein